MWCSRQARGFILERTLCCFVYPKFDGSFDTNTAMALVVQEVDVTEEGEDVGTHLETSGARKSIAKPSSPKDRGVARKRAILKCVSECDEISH
ncbi:hypothetical protein L1987_16718 [Smallanthus sonchifolius]|uniref:Uncharacterized protein n=1 Tax=Smallanthus sonchifolius TaxID=185202 RepID=A0ACB9IUV6_9ASTR|nr:hypothetical protein L1987_16718 [Smallanthus sonchifolius]